MRPFNKLMTAFLLIGGCGGDRFETVPFPDPDANPDDSGKSDHGNDGFGGHAGVSGSAGSAGQAGLAGAAGEEADARADADVDAAQDADHDVEQDVAWDAKDSGTEDVVTPMDAKDVYAPDSGDADASDGSIEPECKVTGIRVRMDAVNGKTIVQANAAIGDASSFTDGVCKVADDRDPSNSSFECCLSIEPSGVVKLWLDFVFSDGTHACTSTASGCSPLTQYSIWFNGTRVQQLYISNNYLPNCMSPGCQWYVYTGP
ncbi:hypothetical protein A3E39_00855 [Candidatus Uhrbacteria bacterium RIFCSPHIGHO2_12_FULL_60_25]|uniref:Uncharacterized protein n=1 Tax=Candidatus Uhrbacteria bacterium RIFCSPHIGHO2_12_FULL_60_25 TaxID=1802399 RepID=A0A1F7UPI1_9BACT|nr:MAG: hypothetical protein A3D73_02945 [Candidatus Uhrbacteria bacterium RIFCSPHIGHO2_02_FULL_60_44]OGL79654.1 MAG: hypothetical protein A3E39_00855 [Candidatus Uhrbacteria bacterium RIFCSPHIGHO2_12_FULL_60_25]